MDVAEAECSYPNKESWSFLQFLSQTGFQTGNLRKDAAALQKVYTVVIPLILSLKIYINLLG